MTNTKPSPAALLTNYATEGMDVSAETLAALDACESGDPRAAELLVGVPCTIGFGFGSGMRRPGKVIAATASLKTITVEEVEYDGSPGRVHTYRLTKRGYRSDRTLTLVIGYADNYTAPEL